MPRVFISYRRQDSRKDVGRIYDRLAQRFGKQNIFKDVDNIPPGVDFRGVIASGVNSCDVVLVVIGQHWLNSLNELGERRLDDPNDFVRIEIESALHQDRARVIPVLVDNAPMPKVDELPVSLRELAFLNAVNVRDDPDFHRDVDRLIEWLAGDYRRKAFVPTDTQRLRRPDGGSLLTPPVMFGGLAVLVVLIAAAVFLSNRNNQPPDVLSSPTSQQIVDLPTSTPEPSVTPVDTAVPTLPTSTSEPTLSSTEIEQTAQAGVLLTQAAVQQSIIIAQTAFALSWTPTFTPDLRATENAHQTETQAADEATANYVATVIQEKIDNQTATAAQWTPTPSVTYTPTPRPIITNTATYMFLPTRTPTVIRTLNLTAQISQQVTLLAGPGANYGTVTTLQSGSRLVILGKTFNEDWYQVRVSETGITGWISASSVTLDGDVNLLDILIPPSPPPPTEVVATPVTLQTINNNRVQVVTSGPGNEFLGSGEIVHKPDNDTVETRWSTGRSRDFIVEATFSNPFPTVRNAWDMGFIFRSTNNGDLRLIISSGKTWTLETYRQSVNEFTDTDQGDLPGLNTLINGSNHVMLIAIGSYGALFVNHIFIDSLDLSDNLDVGDVGIATGMYGGDEVAGASTIYSDATFRYPVLVSGPTSGSFSHAKDGLISSLGTGINRRDFIAEATFDIPSSSNWDIGFLFRETRQNSQFRLSIDSDGAWVLNNSKGDTNNLNNVMSGVFNGMHLGNASTNRLLLLAINDQGLLFINDTFVTRLDLSSRLDTGNISIGTEFFAEDEIDGGTTSYSNFTVWSLSD